MTKDNKNAILNVCFPYTSRDEITTAIRETVTEYTQPIERPLTSSTSRTPFSQSQIEHKVRTQHLSSTSSPSNNNDTDSSSPPTINHLSSSPSSTSIRSPSASSLASSDTTAPSSTTTTTNLPPTSLPTVLSKPPPSSNQPPKLYPSPELISSQTLNSHMFTATNPPLDLLVRTSGVERLSDFMLWQAHQDTEIVFLKCLWPEFDLWSFLPVLVQWQWRKVRHGKVRWQGGQWRTMEEGEAPKVA